METESVMEHPWKNGLAKRNRNLLGCVTFVEESITKHKCYCGVAVNEVSLVNKYIHIHYFLSSVNLEIWCFVLFFLAGISKTFPCASTVCLDWNVNTDLSVLSSLFLDFVTVCVPCWRRSPISREIFIITSCLAPRVLHYYSCQPPSWPKSSSRPFWSSPGSLFWGEESSSLIKPTSVDHHSKNSALHPEGRVILLTSTEKTITVSNHLTLLPTKFISHHHNALAKVSRTLSKQLRNSNVIILTGEISQL